MSFPVTINGNTYAASDFEGYSYITNFPAIIADVATEATNVANNAAIAQNAGGLNYQFNTSTSNADPGSGKLAFNNGTLASATALYISETTDSSQAVSAFLAYWDDSDSTTKGLLKIVKQSDLTVFHVYEITGTITDNGGWDTFTVSYVAGNGTLANNDELTVTFIPVGDKGDAGGPVGDGDYGDITVSSSGTVWSLDAGVVDTAELADDAVTTAKLGNVYRPLVSLDAAQTFALADANTLQRLTGSTNRIWTIPANSAVAFVTGSEIEVFNDGTAELTLTADTGVTVNAVTAGSITLAANQGGVLKKVDTDRWIFLGDNKGAWA